MHNMAPYPIQYQGKKWLTSEALFQSMRFVDNTIIEEIRNQTNPMRAKMTSKKFRAHYIVIPMSEQDIENMRTCLKLKFTQHADLKSRLINTNGHRIIEDIGTRRSTRDKFWGCYRINETEWVGDNMMGKLLMEMRDILLAE